MKRVLVGGVVAILFGSTPTASASSKDCGKRVYAGKNPSCQLARAFFGGWVATPRTLGTAGESESSRRSRGPEVFVFPLARRQALVHVPRACELGCCQFARDVS